MYNIIMPEATVDRISERLGPSNLPEVKIDQKELYHGSGSGDIAKFNPAEETTIGKGLYLTSDINAAAGYAKRRSKGEEGLVPSVYKVEVKNLRMADLRTVEGVKLFADLLRKRLFTESKKPNLEWYQEASIQKTLEVIRTNSYKALKDITWNHQDLVTQIIKDQGFDGLIAIEGGEGDEVGNHDSYVVFDPSKVEIKSKIKL